MVRTPFSFCGVKAGVVRGANATVGLSCALADAGYSW
jgi:hypothetical protein